MPFYRQPPRWLLPWFVAFSLQGEPPRFVETTHFSAPEAHQGVAVGERYFYAIGSRSIGKYDKRTGKRIAEWKAKLWSPIMHLDGGVVVGTRLYCAHSNFPMLPMASSVEVFDTKSLKPIDRHPFASPPGSLTWLDRHHGFWWACFAHYDGPGGAPGKGNRWTRLLKLDDAWRELDRWRFPVEMLKRFAPYSCSGGSWGPDGQLYCSGHDRSELYLVRIPRTGDLLIQTRRLPFPGLGQGIAWDRFRPGVLAGIRRGTRQVFFSKYEGE